jgi:FixJ family two-component response regulator
MIANEDFVAFVVDDDQAILKSISRLLGAKGYQVEVFRSGEEFLDKHKSNAAGCAILDMCMPGLSGLDIQRKLASANIDRPIIFLSGASEVASSVRAMKAGAVDFLTKPFDAKDLITAVAAAQAYQVKTCERREMCASAVQRLELLTPREREVLARVVSGRLNKQIAADLTISIKTVKVHRARVMRKMSARSVVELVRMVTSIEHMSTADLLRA